MDLEHQEGVVELAKHGKEIMHADAPHEAGLKKLFQAWTGRGGGRFFGISFSFSSEGSTSCILLTVVLQLVLIQFYKRKNFSHLS